MIIDGTYIVSGKYGVHVEWDEHLSYLEYLNAVEDLENIGAAVVPHDRWSTNNGDLRVLEDYEGIKDDLDLAQWDLENSEKDSDEWFDARDAVEYFKKQLKDYLTLDWNGYTIIIDKTAYTKYCGAMPDEDTAKDLINWYRAFANNECVYIAIVPLNGDGLGNWESRITSLDHCDLDEMGGDLIPVPETCLLDRDVIKILNENGYHVKDNAQFIEVQV